MCVCVCVYIHTRTYLVSFSLGTLPDNKCLKNIDSNKMRETVWTLIILQAKRLIC